MCANGETTTTKMCANGGTTKSVAVDAE